MAAVILICNGLGILTSDGLQESYGEATPEGRRLSLRHFLLVYLGTLVLGVALAVVLEDRYAVAPQRTVAVFCGGLFALAATGWPWWLFDTFRRLGWFALVSSDTAMRWLLGVLGASLVGLGLFL